MKITQSRFSSHVKFFAQGFNNLWKLTPYWSNNSPCVFVGCYDTVDQTAILNHIGPKVVILTGTGSQIEMLKGCKDLYFINPDDTWKIAGGIDGFIRKNIRPAMKDFSMFQPEKLGTKIYMYAGNDLEKYGIEAAEQLFKVFGKDKFIIGQSGHGMNHVIENFYRPSFLNLQLNPGAGFTTSLEMAHMGRPTVGNFSTAWNIRFESIENLIEKIGKAFETYSGVDGYNLVPDSFFHTSSDWLNTEFYE